MNKSWTKPHEGTIVNSNPYLVHTLTSERIAPKYRELSMIFRKVNLEILTLRRELNYDPNRFWHNKPLIISILKYEKL